MFDCFTATRIKELCWPAKLFSKSETNLSRFMHWGSVLSSVDVGCLNTRQSRFPLLILEAWIISFPIYLLHFLVMNSHDSSFNTWVIIKKPYTVESVDTRLFPSVWTTRASRVEQSLIRLYASGELIYLFKGKKDGLGSRRKSTYSSTKEYQGWGKDHTIEQDNRSFVLYV